MQPFALLIAGPAIAAAGTRLPSWPGRLLPLAIPWLAFVYLLAVAPGVIDGEPLSAFVSWIPGLGVQLAFRLDGWSLLFGLLITGIGALVLIYSRAYMPDVAARQRLEPMLLVFMATMLAAVLADDLITLYVAWELTSVVSFLLIGFDHEQGEARRAAQQALIVTAAGGLAMLAGFVLLGIEADTSRISALAGSIDPTSALAAGAFVGVLAGAVTKSAQFPLHGWLPSAMAAPTPVSAYLHSATMVNLGVYLLGRLHPALGDLGAWTIAVPAFGASTMLVGAWLAVREDDLKRVLAYSTVSALGSMVLLAGLGTPAALKALAVVVVAHALYKAALFLVAGAVDHGAGTRSLASLRGLRRAMPWTAVAAAVAAASLAGVPPTAGFLAKETLVAAGQEGPMVVLLVALVVASALQVVIAGLVAVRPFAGADDPAGSDVASHAHEVSPALWGPPAALAVLGLLGGIALTIAPRSMEAAATAMAGEPVAVSLHLWPGVGPVLLISVVTFALGVAGYLVRGTLERLPWPAASAQRMFDEALLGLTAAGFGLTRRVQNGSLHRYFAVTLLAVAVPVLLVVLRYGGAPAADNAVQTPEGLVVPVIVATAGIAAAVSRSRLQSIMALGGVGFGIALLFATYSAPDVAMTQVLVDTLTVVLLLSAFRFLPVAPRHATRLVRSGDIAIAATVGITMTLLTWSVLSVQNDAHLSAFFTQASLPEAHGGNVVNTILVDFRALDTIGEITVLAVAAVGVIALLTGGGGPVPRQRVRTPSLVLRTATRFLMSLLVVFSLFLLLRGHNEPGGGFAAGLVATAAVTLYAMAYGTGPARRLLRIDLGRLVATGLAIALVSALIGPLVGDAPMTGQWITLGAGATTLALGTPLLFDLGVFAVVLGVSATVVLVLAESR